ncbi:hypothetical protein [Treponema saccharophilum]|uniref:hypothetical protein n=1 Tax=Treponema saccharophilum TaxID=165 RepID=UPI0005947CDD|nr:hypothetical protein [Treponema saccharophilum]
MYDNKNTNTLQHYKYTTEKNAVFLLFFAPARTAVDAPDFLFWEKYQPKRLDAMTGVFMRFTGVSFFAFLTMCFCNNVAAYSNLLEQPVGVLFFVPSF